MSGYFSYYLHCDNCGLTGPPLSLVRSFPDRHQYLLPSSDLETGEFTATEIIIENREQLDQLQEMARKMSTSSRPVSVALLRDHQIVLDPPMSCPKCGELVSHACTANADQPATRFNKLTEVIDATRRQAFSGHRQFVSTAGDISIDCVRSLDDGVPVNQWTVRRRTESGDIEVIYEQLVAWLNEIGSRCSSPKLRTRQVRLIEWL